MASPAAIWPRSRAWGTCYCLRTRSRQKSDRVDLVGGHNVGEVRTTRRLHRLPACTQGLSFVLRQLSPRPLPKLLKEVCNDLLSTSSPAVWEQPPRRTLTS